jgi:hypothetical protein
MGRFLLVQGVETDCLGNGLLAVGTGEMPCVNHRIKTLGAVGMTALINDWFFLSTLHHLLLADATLVKFILFLLFLNCHILLDGEDWVVVNGDPGDILFAVGILLGSQRMLGCFSFQKTHQGVFETLCVVGMLVRLAFPSIHALLTLLSRLGVLG